MSNGADPLNEVASNSDATASGGGSSSPTPTHTSAGGRRYRRGRAKKKAVPVILPALVYQLDHGRRVRVAGGDGQSCGWFPGEAGFRREGTCESWFMCSIGV